MIANKPDRAALRQEFRKKRKQLTGNEQQQAAQAILAQCLNYPPFFQAKRIACYLANDGEVETQAIMQHCWQKQLSLLLPVIHPHKSGHLLFLTHQAEWPMQVNQYGIAEPTYAEHKMVAVENIDIIFTPLVAFDLQGHRLGMGGGYYDRTLAPLAHKHLRPQIIGLAHDCQQAENLPSQWWDIPLQAIITPSKFLHFD